MLVSRCRVVSAAFLAALRRVKPIAVRCVAPLAVLTLLALAKPPDSAAQQGPPPEVRAAIQSLVRMIESREDAAFTTFADERLAPAFRASQGEAELRTLLKSIRDASGGRADDVRVMRTETGLQLILQGTRESIIDFALDENFRFTRLALGGATGDAANPGASDGSNPASAAAAAWGDVSWENLGDRFAGWAGGFNGVVLAKREGQDVLRRAYGTTDPATNRPTTLDAIYCIGSTPIDFTVTGILLLGQRGKLALDDPIGKYLPGVPADKTALTLRHLMSGRSGLPDFHGDPMLDWDPDLAWIDRDTAVRRVLGQPLLFAPGTDESHSHSAFGLLAAVIEIVGGQRYEDFVRTEILAPLGMTRTGFYGERGDFRVEDFAVGSGPEHVGLPNIPPNWGPTSWLVMGSGGMFSTLDDMARYYDAISAGRLLAGEWAAWQQGESIAVGGSDRGYFIFHITNGRGASVLGLMNGEGRAPETRAMMRGVERLVLSR